ncbi:hypothetical protein H113_03719 [Trichophyton rubrum MR1459]|nr:hypothetical protein H113_03719 [Trichophyton rubrum MR1459]
MFKTSVVLHSLIFSSLIRHQRSFGFFFHLNLDDVDGRGDSGEGVGALFLLVEVESRFGERRSPGRAASMCRLMEDEEVEGALSGTPDWVSDIDCDWECERGCSGDRCGADICA